MELNCNKGQTNTGQACVEAFRVPLFIIGVPTTDSLGAANEIDLTDTLDADYFADRVNDVDPSKRWYVLPNMKNISVMRATPEFQTWNDGSKDFIEQGIKDFMGISTGTSGASPQMEGKMNSMRGGQWSFYEVDKSLNLLGKTGSDSTHMAPIKAQSQTIYALLQQAMDKSVPQITFGFNFDITEKDSDLRIIKASEMDYNLSLLASLIDVTAVYSDKSTTTVSVKLLTDGGTMINPFLVKNLINTDFVSSDGGATAKVYNQTDDADVAITGFTESPAGVYNLTFAAQTSGDVIVVKPLKNGYDFTAVEANTFAIP